MNGLPAIITACQRVTLQNFWTYRWPGYTDISAHHQSTGIRAQPRSTNVRTHKQNHTDTQSTSIRAHLFRIVIKNYSYLLSNLSIHVIYNF